VVVGMENIVHSKIIKMIKKYWWVIGIGIILLLFLIWPRKKKEEILERPIITVRSDLSLPVELPRIESVSWTIKENIELPKILKMKIQRQEINEDREGRIKRRLGINDKNGFVDKVNNIIEYSKEIESINQLKVDRDWEIAVFKDKFTLLIEEINEINGLEIVWTEIKHQKILFPRWIEATEEDSQVVEIMGDYVFNGIRLSTFFGEAIKGIFDRRGNLLKLTLSLRPNFIPSDEFRELINIDEASQSPISMYGVFDNQGIEKINKVNITEAEIINVFDNERNLLKPYYWLEGNTFFGNKPVKIKLLLKAER